MVQSSEGINYAELVIEALISLKKFLKFRELGNLLNISIPTLWRYIHGDIKPSEERAKSMLLRLLGKDVVEAVLPRILKLSDGDVVNLYPLVYNIDILAYASIDALLWGKNMGFTAVATVEVDGIPLATMIAKRLGIKLIIIKKKKEVGFDRFIELSYITSMPPEVVTLYLPEGIIEYGDKVLIVDDLVRSGRTSSAVCELIRKGGGRPSGFYALIGIGNAWKTSIMRCVGNNYRVLYELKPFESKA